MVWNMSVKAMAAPMQRPDVKTKTMKDVPIQVKIGRLALVVYGPLALNVGTASARPDG